MLHIIKTPQALHDVLSTLSPNDEILLVEEGVYLGRKQHREHTLLPENGVCVLEADLFARGIHAQISSKLKKVNHTGFVQLTADHEQSITWN